MLKKTDLNTPDLEKLNQLLEIDPASMTFNDREVIRARRDYLTEEQKRVYKSVLEEKVVSTEDVVENPPVVDEDVFPNVEKD